MSIRWGSVRTRYEAIAINVAAGLVGSRVDAQQIFDEAFEQLMRESREGRVNFADIAAARNALLARVCEIARSPRQPSRPRSTTGNVLDLPFDPSDPEIERSSRRHGLLEAALSELEPETRRIFELRFREHQTRDAAARALGVPLAALQPREHALFEKLRHAAEGGVA